MSTFLGYLPKATLVVAAVTAVAAWPVHAWAGSAGLTALVVAAAVCLAGAALGRVPHLFFRRGPDAILHASMAGLGLRLLGTLAIAAPLAFFTDLPRLPFGVALILDYLALLVLEVRDLSVKSRTATIHETPNADGATTR